MALAACSSEEETATDWNGEIRLSSGLSVQEATRAATNIYASTFSGGESIDVYISEQNPTTGKETTYDQPLVYTASTATDGANSLTTTNQPYWPTSGNGVDIYAVYPSGTTSTFTVESDQSGDDAYKASDLMWATASSERTSSSVNLAFKHFLSKVTITLVSGTGTPDLDGAKVELLSVKPSTTLTPSTGVISEATGDATDITVMTATSSDLSGSAIIVPQTLATEFIKVTLANGGTLIGKLSNSTAPTLEAGKEYKYSITVNLTSLNITATITAWNSGDEMDGTATMPTPLVAVDLGLTSGTKWANENVGASSPEDYGDYFAWAETATKDEYTEDNSITYAKSQSELQDAGIIDSDGNLTAAYDAATVNCGSDWKMPTSTQIEELVSGCTWTWTTRNGVNGYEVTGSNGNSIFLPAAGFYSNNTFIASIEAGAGERGCYWTASLADDTKYYAYTRHFDSNGLYLLRAAYFYGFSIRPVAE